ncbi:hypothetical protein BCR34DRAFT_574724 [Clohesyomyces aquaticus]|uniref:Rhodopsin domain-containing protein n=1 Tax=Clohesyomyces aquaticus TaxID=1231657 RepID=A0A1Y1YVC4_9PLEO|nr:hypothetical protein BCR34DRAFT_574724 [Clohesyomyces aquaticus]
MSKVISSGYLAESRQTDLYAAITITYVGAFLAVVLRFWSRKIKGYGYWVDDWLIVAAQVCATGKLVNEFWLISKGYGKHREASGPEIDYYFYLGYFVATIIYACIITLVKYAILALYWRIFGRETIQWPVFFLAFFATAWFISVLFLTIFSCVPTKAFWDRKTKAKCGVDHHKVQWGVSLPNILTDVALLLLPLPHVLRLSTSRLQKTMLMGTFSLGGFVCIASIMTLVSVLRQDPGPDSPWNWVDQGLWGNSEVHFAIISACLPVLRPVWLQLFKTSQPISTASKRPSSRVRTIGSASRSERRNRGKGDDSLLVSTVNSSRHTFVPIPDSNEDISNSIYAPKNGVYTERARLEGYELDDLRTENQGRSRRVYGRSEAKSHGQFLPV